jgi:hypothetical protein
LLCPAEDLPGQGVFVETYPRVPVGETTVDDDSRQAAYAVTGGRHRDVVIVHVANFDIVIGARQKLDQVHSLGAAGAAGCKDLDFSALSHVVLLMSASFLAGLDIVTAADRRIFSIKLVYRACPPSTMAKTI